MAGMRKITSLSQPFIGHAGRVIDPELDMRRPDPRNSPLNRLYAWALKLTSAKEAGSPRRAIARELEESWPAGDRS